MEGYGGIPAGIDRRERTIKKNVEANKERMQAVAVPYGACGTQRPVFKLFLTSGGETR